MGACQGKPATSKEEYLKSKAIDQENYEDYEDFSQIIRLLLLGAGESGKSTLFKQLITLYGNGFSQEQLENYRTTILQNTVQTMQVLGQFSDELDEKFESRINEDNLQALKALMSVRADEIESEAPSGVGELITSLWQDKGIRNTWEQRAQFQCIDTGDYFFDNADRIFADDYKVSYDDMLRCRLRSTGILESEFQISNSKFVLIDVGGQRNERSKWIHSFDRVTAVLFVASMSEFDQVLFEDNSTNRLLEALNLFEEVANMKWFTKSSIVLFLNKRDLLAEKLKRGAHVEEFFREYDGDNSYDSVVQFMEDKFVRAAGSRGDDIFVHVTCATDQENVNLVFDTVKDIFLRNICFDSGLGQSMA